MNEREPIIIPPSAETQRQPELPSKEVRYERASDEGHIPDTQQREAEDGRQIQEIRREISESQPAPIIEGAETASPSLASEHTTIDGVTYTTVYVPREAIAPAFGYAHGTSTEVRDDLPPRVKQFVKSHELYHCQDTAKWGGWMGREIRANVVPGLKDPIGLAATIWETVSDKERLKFYLKRLREGF